MKKLPLAFVAMKFDSNIKIDTRYKHIKYTLEELGYSVIRSDEISTSGPIVEEVCKYLKNADLVVIDSTGDSHSVSYEIGYCHGINRPVESTLLLRENKNIPFNYRHYRHRIYKSKRSIHKAIRNFLKASTPFSFKNLALTISFEITNQSEFSEKSIAKSIIIVLINEQYSGRIEFYYRRGFIHQESNDYQISVSIRKANSKSPELYILAFSIKVAPGREDYPNDLRELIIKNIIKNNPVLSYENALSDFGILRNIRTRFDIFGHIECINGMIKRYLFPKNNKFLLINDTNISNNSFIKKAEI